MQVSELIRSFKDDVTLPINVNAVLACLRDHGCDDEIEFIGVDLDPDILQGMIKVFYARNGVYGADARRMVNIYFHRGHTLDWQRFICCKELIHLLDPPEAHSKTPDELEKLAERMGLPPEMQDPMADGIATNIDRMAEFRAAALLLPLAARDALMPPLRDGRVKLTDIALLADIPLRYAALVMSDTWPIVHDLLSRGAV